jgi:hypothetical protein
MTRRADRETTRPAWENRELAESERSDLVKKREAREKIFGSFGPRLSSPD